MAGERERAQEIVAEVRAILEAQPTVQDLRAFFGFCDPHASTQRLPHGWWVTLILQPLLHEDAFLVLVSPSQQRVRIRVRVEGGRVRYVGLDA